MITSVSWIPKGASKAMPDDAESPSKKKIKELIENGTHKKGVVELLMSRMWPNLLEDHAQKGCFVLFTLSKRYGYPTRAKASDTRPCPESVLFILTRRKVKASFGKSLSGCCCSRASPFANSNYPKKIPPAQEPSNLEE